MTRSFAGSKCRHTLSKQARWRHQRKICDQNIRNRKTDDDWLASDRRAVCPSPQMQLRLMCLVKLANVVGKQLRVQT